MLKCSPEAFAKCPTRHICGERPDDATFADGSECDLFNQLVLSSPQSNADRIRAMSDEELAKYLLDVEQGNFTIDCCDDRFCDTQNCCHDCTEAAIKWLKQPAEVKEDA